MEHYLDSLTLKEVHVAKVRIVTKILAQNAIVAFCITKISIENLIQFEDGSYPDPFCIIKWNDTEVGRTSTCHGTSHPAWENIQIDLRVLEETSRFHQSNHRSDVYHRKLVIEVWDTDMLGLGSFLGRIETHGKSLMEFLKNPQHTVFSLENHPVLPMEQQRNVQGRLRILGNYVKANEFDENKIKSELTVVDTLGDLDTDYYLCELGILACRGLYESSSVTGISTDVFCIVYFNGEEVGRSALVMNNSDPVWSEEVFVLKVPQEEELNTNILLIEVWDISTVSGKGKFLGCVELSGKALITLLCNGKYYRQWFDLEKSMSLLDSDQGLVQGELKLSGRPVAVPITGEEEDATDRDLIEIDLLTIINLEVNVKKLEKNSEKQQSDSSSAAAIMNPKVNNFNTYKRRKSSIESNSGDGNGAMFAIMYFNDRRVHSTDYLDIALSSTMLFFSEININNEKAVVRLPNSKGLSQCTLRIELRYAHDTLKSTSTLNETNSELLAMSVISDELLVSLLGRKGCHTVWVPMGIIDDVTERNDEEENNDNQLSRPLSPQQLLLGQKKQDSIVTTEIKLRGGPLGSPDIYVEDGREFWLDILAAASLRSTKKNGKSDPYCKVIWNGKEIGKTKVIKNSLDPVWQQQRFVLKTPLIDGLDDSLVRCTLCVEIWDDLSHFPGKFLGCLNLKGKKLISFLCADTAQMMWCPLQLQSSLPSKMQELVGGEIKVRGGKAGAKDDPHLDLGEYRLELLSASGLAKADVFDGTEPFAIVYWNGEELRRTKSIGKTVDPIWHNELFLLRVQRNSKLEDQKLALELVDAGHHALLGCVLLSGSKLADILINRDGHIVEFPLTINPEYNMSDHFSYIQGTVKLRCTKIKVTSANIEISKYKDAILEIQCANNLSKSDMFGKSDPFCIVYWKSTLDRGGEEEEIGKTSVIKKSLDPEWEDAKFPIKIPKDDDWSVLSVRIEVWDMRIFGRGPFLGCAILDGSKLESLLSRVGEDCEEPVEYPLVKHPTLPEKDQTLVKGTIVLSGGSKEYYEKKEEELQKAIQFQTLLLETNGNAVVTNNTGSLATIKILRAEYVDKRPISSYAVIKWNEIIIGRSKVAHNSINPVWEEDYFIVQLPIDNNPAACILTIEIYRYRDGGVDDCLGYISMTGKLLQELFRTGKEEMEVTFLNNNTSKDTVLHIQGVVKNPEKRRGSAMSIQPPLSRQESRRVSNLYSTDVEGVLPCQLQLQIFEIMKLTKPDLFGFLNPYVVVTWCGKEVGRTSVATNKASAVWESELFVLDKVAGAHLKDCTLKFDVYNKKTFQSDECIATITLTGQLLIDACGSTDPCWCDLHKYNKVQNNDLYQDPKSGLNGRLQYGLKALKKTVKKDGPLPEGYREVELTVFAATGLAKVDLFGKSDPYCVVSWNDEAIGKTATLKKTLDPIWENEVFILRIPIKLSQPQNDVATLLAKKSSSLGQTEPNVAKKRDILSIEIWHGSQVILSKAVFLGCVEFQGQELYELIDERKNNGKRKWYSLGKTDHLNPKEQRQVQGKIELMVTPRLDPDLDLGGMEIEIFVTAARGLAKADTFGKSDPYCILRWNNRLCGKTTVKKNTLEPVWQDERFKVRVPGSMTIEDCSLYVEVWDWDITGRGDFFGCIKIGGSDLKELVIDNCFTDKWFDLAISEYIPAHLQELVQGQVQVRAGMVGVFGNDKNATQLELSVFSCSDLAKCNSSGTADAYCIAKLNGKDLGSTAIAFKTINPEWINENFPLYLPANDFKSSVLQIEVWNRSLLGKDEFLGCVTLTGTNLEEFINYQSDHERKIWYDLGRINGLDENKQKYVHGKIQIGCKKIYSALDIAGGEDVAIKAEWSGDRDMSSGIPSLELKILSANNLSKVDMNLSNPFCIVTWDGHEKGYTNVMRNTVDPVWNNENFTLRIPMNAEIINTTLVLEVWSAGLIKKQNFLGQIILSFWSILRLFHGNVTLTLEQRSAADTVFGTLTINLSVSFPFWDSAVPLIPMRVIRKVEIISAQDLCFVNDSAPSTKCKVIFDGFTKAKSVVVSNSAFPQWPQVCCEVILDMYRAQHVAVHIFHVDSDDKREVCIGVAEIPYEFLMRPPTDPWEIWLTPHPKEPPVKYHFSVKGSVRVRVSGDTRNSLSLLPWTSSYHTPLSALTVRDLCMNWNELSLADEGDLLTHEQRLWLGTSFDLSSVQELANRPEWIVIPFRDFGLKINDSSYGTKPGHRYALCVERPNGKAPFSDTTLIREIYDDMQTCITRLREREIFVRLREHALEVMKLTAKNFARKNQTGVDNVIRRMANAIMLCIPGCSVFTAVLSSDFRTLQYSRFQSTSSVKFKEFSQRRMQGCDWECIDRNAKHFTVKKFNDFQKRRITCHRPFRHTRFPRLVIPLKTGDASMGIVGVENFDIYDHGCNFIHENDGSITKWLFEMGAICGELLYNLNESKAVQKLEEYLMRWYCSGPGFLKLLLECMMDVLQGCQLVEAWAVSSAPNDTMEPTPIRSITYKSPAPPVYVGRRLIISKVSVKKCAVLDSNVDSLRPPSSARSTSSRSFRKNSAARAVTPATGLKRSPTFSSSMPPPGPTGGLIFGIRYSDMEHCQVLQLQEPSTPAAAATPILAHRIYTVGLDTELNMTNERDLIMSIYRVDENLQILSQHSGVVQLVTLQENEATCKLVVPKELYPEIFSTQDNTNNTTNNVVLPSTHEVEPSAYFYSLTLSFTWPTDNELSIGETKRKNVKEFTFHVKRAYGIKKADSFGSTDPYFVAKWGTDIVHRSLVRKGTLEPAWDDKFSIPFTMESKSVVIEVWASALFGKDVFLGQVEVAIDILLFPPTSDVDAPLTTKPEFNPKKQKTVGGYLVFHHDLVMKENTENAMMLQRESMIVENKLLSVPKDIFGMTNVALHLRILHAFDLAKVDLIGSSDPFAMVFIGKEQDCVGKTAVINNDLNPVWNAEFTINLGVHKPENVSLNDFPTLRIEVWDMNRSGTGDFLGQIELSPTIYLHRRSGDFSLLDNPTITAAQNKRRRILKSPVTIKGTISLEFQIIDNVIKSQEKDFILSNIATGDTLYPILYLEVIILNARDLPKPNKNLKSNPYCRIIWNDNVIGHTVSRSNTMNPNWTNETFLINLSVAHFLIKEMVIEVWNKSFFADDVFIGEIRIPSTSLLHPILTQQTIQLQSKPSKNSSKIIPPTGSLTFKLSSRRVPQRIEFPMDEVIILDEHENIETESEQSISIIKDLNAEIERQKFDKLHLPKLLDNIKKQTEESNSKPFERHGLISELNYGQFISACGRRERTTLKTSTADYLCIPAGLLSLPSDTNTPISPDLISLVARYYPFKISRRDIQYLDQLKLVAARGMHLLSARTQRILCRNRLLEDIVRAPTMKISPDEMLQHTLTEFTEAYECKVDLYLLEKDGINFVKYNPGILSSHNSRSNHNNNNNNMDGYMAESNRKLEDYASGLMKLAARLCRHKLLLQLFRGTFTVADLSWESVPQVSLTLLDDIARIIKGAEGPKLIRDLKKSAPLEAGLGACYIPIMGHMEVCMGMIVLSGLDNVTSCKYKILKSALDYAKNIDSMKDAMNNDSNNNQKTNTSHHNNEEFIHQETVGKNKKLDSTQENKANTYPDTNVEDESLLSDDTITVIKPEEGFTNSLLKISKSLGSSLFDMRMAMAYKEINAFISNSITAATSITDIFRTVFLALLTACPVIREMSIWSVDLAQPVMLLTQGKIRGEREPVAGSKAFGAVAASKGHESSSSNSESSHSLTHGSNSDRKNEKGSLGIGDNAVESIKYSSILAGYFGTEDISSLYNSTQPQIPSAIAHQLEIINSKLKKHQKISKSRLGSKNLNLDENNLTISGASDSFSAPSPHPSGSFTSPAQSPHGSFNAKDNSPLIITVNPGWAVTEPAIIKKQREYEMKNNTGFGDKNQQGSQSRIISAVEDARAGFGSRISKLSGAFHSISGGLRKDSAKNIKKKATAAPSEVITIGGKYSVVSGANELLHAEIVRCVSALKLKSFLLVSGHLLCNIAESENQHNLLNSLFFPAEKAAFEAAAAEANANSNNINSSRASTPLPPPGAPPASAMSKSTEPNRPPARAPLPPGRPPLPHQQATAQLQPQPSKGMLSRIISTSGAPAAPVESTPADVTAAIQSAVLSRKYFFAVCTHGIGSTTGELYITHMK